VEQLNWKKIKFLALQACPFCTTSFEHGESSIRPDPSQHAPSLIGSQGYASGHKNVDFQARRQALSKSTSPAISEILGSQGSQQARLLNGEVSNPAQVCCLHEVGLWHAKGTRTHVWKESTTRNA